MKYLLIFLPIFCFAQGGDSTLYGTRIDIDSFRTTSHPDTCWEIKNGWMSLKPGCVQIPTFNSSGTVVNAYNFNTPANYGLYYSDRKPKVVESFKYLGAYYELHENGWYKEILPDTIPDYTNGDIKVKGDSVFRWTKEPKWVPCDQHFGNVDHPKRDKIEQSEVKILVWTGCTLAEYKATKFCGYNYYDDQFFMSGGTMKRVQKDFIAWYLAGDKWIKSSHVIKELWSE